MDYQGPPAQEIKQTDDVTWKEYKRKYAVAFGPLLDRLRQDATESWEVEELIERVGERIETGTTHHVDLLHHAHIELSGEGRAYVRPNLEDTADVPLALHVRPASLKHEWELDVTLAYSNGECQRLKFFIVSPELPSNIRRDLERNFDHDSKEDYVS